MVESREKSSMDAGSEGEVMMSGEACSDVVKVALLFSESALLVVLKDRSVGKLGVDLDWKPAGAGEGLRGWPLPLLCGGIVLCEQCPVVVDVDLRTLATWCAATLGSLHSRRLQAR